MPKYLRIEDLVEGANYEFAKRGESFERVFLGLVNVQGKPHLAWGHQNQLRRYLEREAFHKEFPHIPALSPIQVSASTMASCRALRRVGEDVTPFSLDTVSIWTDALDNPIMPPTRHEAPPTKPLAKTSLREVQISYRQMCLEKGATPLQVKQVGVKPIFAFRERNKRVDVFRLMPSDDGQAWLLEGGDTPAHQTLTDALQEIIKT